MRILVLNHGGYNDKDRLAILKRLGHEVQDELLYRVEPSFWNRQMFRLAVRVHVGPWIGAVNVDLEQRSKGWSGFDLVWMEKAQYVFPETIDYIKARVGCPVAHYTPDIAIRVTGTQKSPIFHRAIPSYDAIVTTKDFEVAEYKKRGAACVILTDQAVNHNRIFPRRNLGAIDRSRIGFIGHAERHYRDLVGHLARNGIAVDVRGPGWTKARIRYHPRYRTLHLGGPVYQDAYAAKLSGMDVGLGFLTKLGPEVVTTRSLEIPACGTFLLAERTEKHYEIFKEGEEAEFFSSKDELVDKARYYLAHPLPRERIAAAGYRRFLDGPFRLDRQMARLVDSLTSALALAPSSRRVTR
ncbi:hypothetical protein Thimo_0995 [Thioflavicoccus mobilis 8321]|uniref:Spore protein YkvP/CgeB glycosyl transferase-like domain-containing protein n=1 Tax=Thioflavicoccus mobilis 8321 TaxID=765912 RepID=L0GVF8_9GAMM|nr:glycosyltransferase [Thioflavicoccus mobilis]AGA89817.1 hypothetical protein Thimo_0995 [Thioflavicoccus mobilis 8321]